MIERCGVIVGGEIIEYENISPNPCNEFELPLDALIREDLEGIWHTHPCSSPYLSASDRLNQIASDLPWHLGENVFDCVPLLVGREFNYGIADCGTIIEDAYMLMSIKLDETTRNDMNEEVSNGYITERLESVGFYQVKDIQAGDVIVTTYQGSAEHMMLYLGDDKILHHLYNRLSRVEFYNDHYRRNTSYIYRHKDYKNDMINAVINDLEASNYG